METKTLGLITVGQVVGRGVQEATPYLDAKVPAIVGQPVSRLVELVGGAGLMYLSVMKSKMKADTQLVSAIVGSRLVTDELVDIVKGALVPGVGLRPPSVRIKAPAGRISTVPEYSNGGLITVD